MPHPDQKPSIAGAPLSVAIPVRNQANRLEAGLTTWVGYLHQLERPYEILLVDDGSTDDSVVRARNIADHHATVVLLQHDRPLGFGAALRTALQRAQYPLFFYTALDYPYAPSDLRKLLDRIDDVDLVTGFRAAAPVPRALRSARAIWNALIRIAIGLRSEPAPGWLGAQAHIYSRMMQVLLGVHIGDTDSAFKLFRREIFARLPIQSDGPFAHVEILAKANFLTCWMDEVPIGAADGAQPDALCLDFQWKERWRDMREVFFHPDFGPWPPLVIPSASAAAAPAG